MLLRPLTSASHPPPDYFVDHMGDYEDVLASLETLNHSVLKAMGYTKKVSGCGWAWVKGLSAGLGLRASWPKGAWVCDDRCWVKPAPKQMLGHLEGAR